MGNKDSKPDNPAGVKTKTLFKFLANNEDKLEKKIVQVKYTLSCQNVDLISYHSLQNKWSETLDERLLKLLIDELFPSGSPLDFQGFDKFASIMLDGNYGDKAEIILHLISSQNAAQYDILRLVNNFQI